MNKQTPIVLAVAGAVALGAGLMLAESNSGQTAFESQPLIPELNAQAESLSAIKVEDANGLIVVVKKLGDQWVIENLDGYPAKVDSVAKFVKELVDVERIEQKTANPDKFHRLGLRDVTDEDSQAAKITISADKDYSVLLGNYPKTGGGRYARLADDNQSWLINAKLYLPTEANTWVDRDLIDFAESEIKQIVVKGESELTMSRDNSDTDFTTALDEGKQLKYPGILGQLSNSVAGLRFDKPAALDAQLWNDSKSSLVIDVALFNETNVKLKIISTEQTHWLRLSAATNIAEQQATVSQWNQDWQIWQYQLADYAFSDLNKQLIDFVEDIPAD